MNGVGRRFLPDRFRPRSPRRRATRRGLLLPVVAVTVLLLALPVWTVGTVEIRGAEVVPPSVTASLEGVAGHLVPLLDLAWLHEVAATWPAANEVQVQLELPGTVVIEIYPESARGSVAVGSGWHAVAADGRLAGVVDGPVAPELRGLRRPTDRRTAFSVARRLAEGCGGEVVAVEMVTPDDYRVELRFGNTDRVATVHVTPGGTAAENAWCELVSRDVSAAGWADLRWAHRMVIRETA